LRKSRLIMYFYIAKSIGSYGPKSLSGGVYHGAAQIKNLSGLFS